MRLRAVGKLAHFFETVLFRQYLNAAGDYVSGGFAVVQFCF